MKSPESSGGPVTRIESPGRRETPYSRDGFKGPILAEDDEGYEEVRRVHNGLVDKRPAIIARCTTTEDVTAAVAFGRESGLEISVRGGGHNVAGIAVTDGGLMVDLSLMRQVDPDAPTITAGGGVTWGELNDGRARIRAGDDRRGRLDHGHRRAHARRRDRLDHGQVRDGRGQPDIGRDGPGLR